MPNSGGIMSDFDSLTLALEGWFSSPLGDLPVSLRDRVKQELFPLPWDELSTDQRRVAALQWDYQNGPVTEQEREQWFDLEVRKQNMAKQIAEWEAVDSPTATDLATKETRLQELQESLAHLEHQQRNALGDYSPKRDTHPAESIDQYIAYPKAMKLLSDRLGATPEELAMWIFMGTGDGGISAFLNANELDIPYRFRYGIGHGNDFDYLSPLMACWFREGEILAFEPTERYITGSALIERWNNLPHIQPEAFIRAKIAESRLLDAHPIYGLTQGSQPGDTSQPPLTMALFDLSHVEAIEQEDFGVEAPAPPEKPRGHLNHDPELQAQANQIAAEHKTATGRSITREKVAQQLAKQLPLDAATIERRIRKQWK